ncbi:MAG: FadR family transcriptional regulator [Spirochaetales bacterium]|nr:FadR family transcriptional regulator [Spirochaetales bacterium]
MDLALFKTLDSANIKDEFVIRVEELILTEKIVAGDRLPPERELASHYGVSRPLIHEGILVLENRGLVTLRPRHGVIVNNYREQATLDMLLSLLKGSGQKLSPELTEDLEHFRIHIEKDIVSLICRGAGGAKKELKKLRHINQKMAKGKSASELAEFDFQFHLQLALLSGNALYALLYNTMKPAHMDLLTRFYETSKTRNQVVRFHEMLISALQDEDEKTAEALIGKGDSYSGYNEEDS